MNVMFTLSKGNLDTPKPSYEIIYKPCSYKIQLFVTETILSIIGRFGYSNFIAKFNHFDENFLMKIFCVEDMDHGMKKLFEEREMKGRNQINCGIWSVIEIFMFL